MPYSWNLEILGPPLIGHETADVRVRSFSTFSVDKNHSMLELLYGGGREGGGLGMAVFLITPTKIPHSHKYPC